jgi:hypothetical protein
MEWNGLIASMRRSQDNEPLIECHLRLFPGALPFGSLRVSSFGRFDAAATRIVACANLQPALATSACMLHVSIEASICMRLARSLGRMGPSLATCDRSRPVNAS